MSSLRWEIRSLKSFNDLRKFLDKNHSKMDGYDWSIIVRSPGFDCVLIPEFSDKLPWGNMCIFIEIPSDILDVYSEKLNWHSVSIFQTLTKEFIEKHQHELSLNKLLNNPRIPNALKPFVEEIFNNNNDPEHHKRWDYNLNNDVALRPRKPRRFFEDYDDDTLMAGTIEWELYQENKVKGILTKDKKSKSTSTKKIENNNKTVNKPTNSIEKKTNNKSKEYDYSKMTKAQLKEILAKRNVKTLYHDTLEILIKKCKESEGRKNDSPKRSKT